MHHAKRWLTLFLVLTLAAMGILSPRLDEARQAAAQQTGGPLLLLKNGDLWSWTPGSASLTQLTTWGYNERPVLSPDGSRVAYNSWATVTIDALAQGLPVVGVIPSNIRVMDLATGQPTQVVDQPASATLAEEGGWQNAIMRGTPAWSPDGAKLAWSELVMPDYAYRLVVYDLATASATVIVENLPSPFADAGNIPLHTVQWGEPGISVYNTAVNADSGDFEERLLLYAPDGTPLAEHLIGSSATEFVMLHDWMNFEGQPYIGLLYPSGKQFLLDPLSGEQTEMSVQPELVSTTASGPSIALTLAPNSDPESDQRAIWFLLTPDRQSSEALPTLGLPTTSIVAIAPDGLAVAHVADVVGVWRNGASSPVPETDDLGGADGLSGVTSIGTAVVWGPMAWRVPSGEESAAALFGLGGAEETAQDAQPPAQGGALLPYCAPTPRLTIGATGQVTPGLPNVVRSLPRRGPDSIVLGSVPGMGIFTVLEGPVCGPEGRFWWRINYQGLVGWTPEGQGGIYWLQPYNTQPVRCTLAPRLQVGAPGYVLPGLPNLLRSQPRPGPDSLILGRIPGGAFFNVVGGPECGTDGRLWWLVSYAGITGWTAEGEGSQYWVSPFVCQNSPLPRLSSGIIGRVTPGDPNTLRVSPSANSSAVGQIPAGATFIVLNGPQCGPEGWSWWRVNYNGVIGWTAEGSGSTYWLEPYVGLPEPPVTCSLTPRLMPGGQGRVTPGESNVLRTQPRRAADSQIVGYIPALSTFRVLEGPICGPEGRYWWRVDYSGLIGWTPEGENGIYWLDPLGITPPTPPVACTLAPRLQVGAAGYVLPGPSNVLRSQPRPGAGSDIVGQIPGGGYFRVLEGPVCGPEGRYWFRVDYQGVAGWTAEGQDPDYWTATFVCAFSEPTRLVPGMRARVTPGDPNTLRSQPGTGADSFVIGSIPGGGEFTVVSGPQCGTDGRIWWQVNYGGALGWTPEGEGSAYWLEPVY